MEQIWKYSNKLEYIIAILVMLLAISIAINIDNTGAFDALKTDNTKIDSIQKTNINNIYDGTR